MGIRAAVAACVIIGATQLAAADPFAWRAPDDCPTAADARARIERRLGATVQDPIDVAIERDDAGYVARVGTRTLHSETCDALTDAIAIVVTGFARAPTAPARRSPVAEPGVSEWGGGGRGSWLTGIGGVPAIGVGGELAGYVRHHRWYAELAVADWAQGAAITGMPHMDFGLATTTLRAGYAPEPKAIRGWLAVDVGRMTGSADLGSTGWVAVGPGFAVAWPIAPRLRLVGSLELLASVDRARFAQAGMTIYDSSPLVARTTLGLEVGWR